MEPQKHYIIFNSYNLIFCTTDSYSVACDIVKIEEKEGNTGLTIKEASYWNSTSLYLIEKYKVTNTHNEPVNSI